MMSNPPTWFSSPVSLRKISLLQSLHIDDSQNIVNEPTLQLAVGWGVRSHGRTAVDFDDPRLQG